MFARKVLSAPGLLNVSKVSPCSSLRWQRIKFVVIFEGISWTAQMVSHLDSLPFPNAATAVGCAGKLLYFSRKHFTVYIFLKPRQDLWLIFEQLGLCAEETAADELGQFLDHSVLGRHGGSF